MADREYVKNLDAVRSLNDELRNQEKLLTNLKGKQADLALSVMTVADAHDKSGKYNKENLNLAKRQSKAGKDVLNVIKAQNKGNTLSIVAAKAKLI